MRIRWDAALTAATARALDARFHGARVRAVHLDPVARRAVLYLRDATLVWELHPERVGFHLLDPAEPPPEARRLPGRLRRAVSPPDERVLRLDVQRLRGRPTRSALIVELIPNQENALFLEGEEDTVRVLLRTREGERVLRRGQPYQLPPPSDRVGADDPPGPEVWDEVLDGLEGRDRVRAISRRFAWTSPIVAPTLAGPGGYAAWVALRERVLGEPGPAALLLGRHGPQPYPVVIPEQLVQETEDILAAFQAADEASEQEAPALVPGELIAQLERAVERARSRVASLESEQDKLRDPDELQLWGDLLLARFHLVPTGEEEVTLEGFEGGAVTIPLDPTLSPDANARRHYDRAARVRRALEELPGRIAAARTKWDELATLLDRARTGGASREDVAAAVPAGSSGSGKSGQDAPSLPYRVYRSSGGLEIRVGRGSARNDDLTFRHSSPHDIWLHARHTAGAHVILRWTGEDAPPARDLEEAAILAALNSKARTSGSVPVDWTRRKYVRKPRKAPAGSVIPDRVQTVFVAPDESVAEALREE